MREQRLFHGIAYIMVTHSHAVDCRNKDNRGLNHFRSRQVTWRRSTPQISLLTSRQFCNCLNADSNDKDYETLPEDDGATATAKSACKMVDRGVGSSPVVDARDGPLIGLPAVYTFDGKHGFLSPGLGRRLSGKSH